MMIITMIMIMIIMIMMIIIIIIIIIIITIINNNNNNNNNKTEKKEKHFSQLLGKHSGCLSGRGCYRGQGGGGWCLAELNLQTIKKKSSF